MDDIFSNTGFPTFADQLLTQQGLSEGGGEEEVIYQLLSQSIIACEEDGTPVGVVNGCGELELYVGDTTPGRCVFLKRTNETPFDLTGATVVYILVQKSGTGYPGGGNDLTVAGSLISGPAGMIKFVWATDGSQTSTKGTFQEYWRITFPDSRVMTVPGPKIRFKEI